MPATIIDSAVLGDIFSTEAMREVFSDENRVRHYLTIEAALARVQGELGVIPARAAEAVAAGCTLDAIDFARLKTETERIGYPVLPVVRQVAAHVGELGEYCHWGATTQDITDTATVLQIREALVLVEDDLAAIADALADLAARHRDTPMAGRSNLQQATPITFGFKAARLLASIERHRARLAELRPRVLVGELGGASGTLASLGDRGLEVQARLMDELGLGRPLIAWHTERDAIAEVGCFLGLVTGTLGKLATDVKLLMQTEVGEVFEPFHDERGSSSTMPQKRNPISCVYVHACAAMVRQHVAALLDAMLCDHERGTGPWEIEWIALPSMFALAGGALRQARALVGGLEVDAAAMRRNLALTQGLLSSEAVMMALAGSLGRGPAHDVVYAACRRSLDEGQSLLDVLSGEPEVAAHLDRRELAALLDPSGYVGLAGPMVERVLAARGPSADEA